MKKGFTLIELLIVIAILAVLATSVILVLNPAELIKQARDSTRLSDLAALNSAIALYLADVKTPFLAGPAGNCTAATERCTSGTAGRAEASCTTATSTAVDGNGWVRINFGDISSGSPLSRLPSDPNNGSANCGTSGSAEACFYSYACDTLDYELGAAMESTRYIKGGPSDVEDTDGGSTDTTGRNTYEVGNKLDI